MIRLQKLLAEAGLGSRRSIEEWIRAGRLAINGRIARLGDRAGPDDSILLDGKRLDVRPAPGTGQWLLYHKPIGELTTRRDPDGRPTVFDRVPSPRSGRWITVGRLDVNTSGLLLFTTDGDLAHRLMHPSGEVEREYLVRVRGRPTLPILQQLAAGVRLDDGVARFDRLEQVETHGSHSSFRVVLREGRNREVRRLWEAVGFEVSRLLRVRYGPIELPRDLAPGSWRSIDAQGVAELAECARGSTQGMRLR